MAGNRLLPAPGRTHPAALGTPSATVTNPALAAAAGSPHLQHATLATLAKPPARAQAASPAWLHFSRVLPACQCFVLVMGWSLFSINSHGINWT